MSLTIEQQLTKHELGDERRFGQIERHLERIEGKIDVITIQVVETRKKTDSVSDEVEKTGSHELARTKSVLWIVLKSIGAVALVLVAAFAGHFIK